MPTLNIGGRKVTVDDSFMSLPLEQQNSTVDEIAKSLKIPPASSFGGVGDFFKSIPRGIVKGFTSSAMGGDPDVLAAQVGMGQTPEDIIGEQKRVQEELPAAIEKLPLPKPQGTAGRFGESVGEAVGNPASWIGPGSVPFKAGANVLSGVGAQVGEELTDSAIGRFIGGTLAPMVPRVATKLYAAPAVPAKVQQPLARFKPQGIEPMAGDVRDSKTLRFWEEAGDYPLGAKSYSENLEKLGRQINRAAGKFMDANVDELSPDVFDATKKSLQKTFDDVASKLPVNPDTKFNNDVVKLVNDLHQEGLSADEVNRVMKQVNNMIDAMAANTNYQGRLGGSTYQSITRHDAPLDRAMNDANPNISYYATRLRSALDDALERTARGRGTRPGTGRQKALDDLEAARKQWYAMLVLSKSVDDNGFVNLAQLRQNLRNTVDNKWAWAAARTDLHQFGRDLRAIIKPERSSRTTERHTTQQFPIEAMRMLEETKRSPSAMKLLIGPVGRAINSPLIQEYLKGQRRGQQGAANILPSIPPSSTSLMRGYLNSIGVGTQEDNTNE